MTDKTHQLVFKFSFFFLWVCFIWQIWNRFESLYIIRSNFSLFQWSTSITSSLPWLPVVSNIIKSKAVCMASYRHNIVLVFSYPLFWRQTKENKLSRYQIWPFMWGWWTCSQPSWLCPTQPGCVLHSIKDSRTFQNKMHPRKARGYVGWNVQGGVGTI